MPIIIYTGKPGAGKTMELASVAISLLKRNYAFYKKSGIVRPVYLNIMLSNEIEQKFDKDQFIRYWSEPRQLTSLRDVDVLWDEIPTHLDATEWANMSLELKRWLQQHRKFGIEIYGTAQSFSQVDISARRLVSDLFWLTKVIGSRDPSPTLPPVKFVWGLGVKRRLNPMDFDEQDLKFPPQIPGFFFYEKRKTEIFDTRQEITSGEYPPMRHIARECERQNCSFIKVIHK